MRAMWGSPRIQPMALPFSMPAWLAPMLSPLGDYGVDPEIDTADQDLFYIVELVAFRRPFLSTSSRKPGSW